MGESQKADLDGEGKSRCSEAGEARGRDTVGRRLCVGLCLNGMTEERKCHLFSTDKDWDYIVCLNCEDSRQKNGPLPSEALRGGQVEQREL